MKNPIAAGRQNKDCAHLESITGSSSGIKRDVCKDCGHVSVSYIGVAITKEFGELAIGRERGTL